ncbi:hypothetical protein QTP70_005657 [Hemibagrus guttatus]|uniref:SERTA domain-containing protein n=1 Tax=Hemibagrus guttatus TaxID=175788 RepID=A0AAE0UL80_9TELE|nr:hypothetical protein QTP70_005657 [Hemibagrus guttatus]
MVNTCHMSCMGPRRTLESEDEDEPEPRPKMAAVWAESSTAYSWQRQTVLQLSLQKLCHVPSLGRRVLITNTLRLIQEEISHQGAPRPSPPAEDRQKLSQRQALEVSLTPAWVLEQDAEPDFSPKDGFNSTLAEIHETSASSSSSLSELEANRTEKESPMQTICLESHLDFAQPSLNHAPSLPSSCPAFLPDLSLDDFLFSDLDNFLCELNPCTLNLSPSPGSQSKVVSMVTDDLVRSLTNQPFRTDLNDLEHLMEVLVGSWGQANYTRELRVRQIAGQTDCSRELRGQGQTDCSRELRGRGQTDCSRELRGRGQTDCSRELRGRGQTDCSRELRGRGQTDCSRELRGQGQTDCSRELRRRGQTDCSRELRRRGQTDCSRELRGWSQTG